MRREEWNDLYRAVPVLWPIDPGPFLGVEVGDKRPGRALDLGAGEGRNSIWLAKRGVARHRVDFSDVAVARGQAWAEEEGVAELITWLVAHLAEFRPEARGSDLCSACSSTFGALAPGGTVLIVGYDRANATEGTEGFRDPALLFSPEDHCGRVGWGCEWNALSSCALARRSTRSSGRGNRVTTEAGAALYKDARHSSGGVMSNAPVPVP